MTSMCSFSNNRLVIVLCLVVASRYEEQNTPFCKVTHAKNRIFYLHFREIHCTLSYVEGGLTWFPRIGLSCLENGGID